MANSHKLVAATDAHAPALHASTHQAGGTDIMSNLQATTIELGHASDTTLARVSAGVVSIEGTNIVKAGAATGSGLTMATARMLGRTTASTGAIEEITVGTGLSLSGGSLTATGGAGSGPPPSVCEGRLTLTTATPITTSDVTAATTLYFTPYKGSYIGTYSGSAWTVATFSEKSITLASLTAGLPY